MSPRHIPPGKEDLWRRQEEIDAEYARVSRDLDAADRKARRLYEEFGEDSITEEADEEVARLCDELTRVTEVSNRVYMERMAGLTSWIDQDPTAPICGTCQGAGHRPGTAGHDVSDACPDCRGWGREHQASFTWNEGAQAFIDPATGREVDILSPDHGRPDPPPKLPPTATPDIPSPTGGTEMRKLCEGDDLPPDLPLGGDCPAETMRILPGYGPYEYQCHGDAGHKGDHYAAADTTSGREFIAAVWDDEEAARNFREQAEQAARDEVDYERDRRRFMGEPSRETPYDKPHPTSSEYMAAVDAWMKGGGTLRQFDGMWADYMAGNGQKPEPRHIDPADKQREAEQMQREENEREAREADQQAREDRDGAGPDRLPWWWPKDLSQQSFNDATELAARIGNLRDYMESKGDPLELVAWAQRLYEKALQAQKEAGDRMNQRIAERKQREERDKQPPTGGGQGGTGMSDLENARGQIMTAKASGDNALAALGQASSDMEDTANGLRAGAEGSNQPEADEAFAEIQEGMTKVGEGQQLLAQALQKFEGVAQRL